MDMNNNSYNNTKINVTGVGVVNASNNNNMDHQQHQENILTKQDLNTMDTMASSCITNSTTDSSSNVTSNVANKSSSSSSSHFDNQLNLLNNNFHLDQILCNLFIHFILFFHSF